MIRDVNSEFRIPDLDFFHPGSRGLDLAQIRNHRKVFIRIRETVNMDAQIDFRNIGYCTLYSVERSSIESPYGPDARPQLKLAVKFLVAL
jgi:hypothetical protein